MNSYVCCYFYADSKWVKALVSGYRLVFGIILIWRLLGILFCLRESNSKLGSASSFLHLGNSLGKYREEQIKAILATLDNGDNGFMMLDENWRFIYINGEAARNVGREPKDLIDKNLWDAFPSIVGTRAEACYRKAMAERVDICFEDYGGRTERWYEEKVHPTAQGIAVFLNDITERKREEERLRTLTEELDERVRKAESNIRRERARLFSVLESMPMMVCLLTEDHRIAFMNDLFRQRFGEANGKHCYEHLFDYGEPCKFCKAYDVYKTRKATYWQLEYPDGSIFDVYNSPFTDVDGSAMILKVAIDITERQHLEKQLQDKEQTAATGENPDIPGHNLRNPLQAIIGEIHLATAGLEQIPECEQKDKLQESIDNIEE